MPRKIALSRKIAGVRFPNSVLAQKAVDLAFRVSPAVVWHHVLRTFVFGALVGKAQSLRYDEELFFLASVLHDLGLTAEFRGAERFEVVGADAADAFLKDQGVNPERGMRLRFTRPLASPRANVLKSPSSISAPVST
jgi:hypothetical protein